MPYSVKEPLRKGRFLDMHSFTYVVYMIVLCVINIIITCWIITEDLPDQYEVA